MGFAAALGAIASAVGGIAGQSGWLNNSASDSLHKSQTTRNRDLAISYDRWRALNMPSLLKQGFRDAGMNPILVANNGSLPSGSLPSSMINSAKSDIDLDKSLTGYYNRKVAKEDIRNRQKHNEVMDSQKDVNEAQSAQLASSSAKNLADTKASLALANKYENETKRIQQEMKISSVSAKEAAIVSELLDQNDNVRDMHRRQYMYKNTTRDSNPFYDFYKEATYGLESEKHLKSARDIRHEIEDRKEQEERSKRQFNHSKSRGIQSIFRK